jgi:hypothetical protein
VAIVQDLQVGKVGIGRDVLNSFFIFHFRNGTFQNIPTYPYLSLPIPTYPYLSDPL